MNTTKPNFFEFAYGRVYYRFKPTARDKVGCAGIYISRVVLSPGCVEAAKRAVALLAGKSIKANRTRNPPRPTHSRK